MSKKENSIFKFFKMTLFGGVVVVLPLSILIFLFKWLLGILTGIVKPITDKIVEVNNYSTFLVEMIAVLILLLLCFFIGLFVKTKVGHWLFSFLEDILFSKLPGYGMVKETVTHIFNHGDKSPFSSVVLCQPFGNETFMTGFVTDKHPSGYLTVFVPTGPNPTSGFIFHLQPGQVFPLEASAEESMRSIISCGAGSKVLVNKLVEKYPEQVCTVTAKVEGKE